MNPPLKGGPDIRFSANFVCSQTCWSRNRADSAPEPDLDWWPESALLARPRDAVEWIALDAAGCAFLDACAAGSTLAGAAQAALEVKGNADLARLMSSLLEAGTFGGMSCNNDQQLDQQLTEEHP